MTFHLTCVHIILVRFRLLSGYLLGNSCSLCLSYVLFVFLLLLIFVIFRFGFEGLIWVLIASVPDLYIIHFTFRKEDLSKDWTDDDGRQRLGKL